MRDPALPMHLMTKIGNLITESRGLTFAFLRLFLYVGLRSGILLHFILWHHPDPGTDQTQGGQQPRPRTYRDEEDHHDIIDHYTQRRLQL
jgi:hypothetical protein